MSKVTEVVGQYKAEKQNQKSTRKVANQDQYDRVIQAIISDPDFEVEDFVGIEEGVVITEKSKPAEGIRSFIAAILCKAGFSAAEAAEAAASTKITKALTQSIVRVVREADYLVCEELQGKVRVFKKPGLEVAMVIDQVQAQTRNNPRNRVTGGTDKILIAARSKAKLKHTIHAFQKSIIEA